MSMRTAQKVHEEAATHLVTSNLGVNGAKAKTLSEVLPDPVEQLRRELNALKATVAIDAEEIRHLKTLSDAAVDAINELHTKIDEGPQKTETRQLQVLQSIATSVEGIYQVKKAYADKMNGRETARKEAHKEQADNGDEPASPSPFNLTGINLTTIPDLSLLDVEYLQDSIKLTPKKFLGDRWGPINDVVQSLGGGWTRDGRHSHWFIEGGPAQFGAGGLLEEAEDG